ncbi:UNVERIFIED_CONTAM: hypothetical protein PYX00_005379 [Menopon gallinae]|uniref:DUF7805 domain-containing protein n=1 Tax=Menopon gallinae TaxID=328185 RepID=A0AAW2HSD0_9NEOP
MSPVYDGYTTRDPVLLKFCGNGEPVPETISSGPELLVEFSTSPYGTFLYPTPSQSLHGFQLEVKVYFVDQDSPFFTRNKRCEFNLRGTGKGVLESPHHTLSPNTTCSYYLEGTDAPKPTPTFRPTPGRYPIQYDPKYWQRQTPPPSPPPPIRYRVWLSVLKFSVSPPRDKSEEDCAVQLQVWDGNLREACGDVFCDKEKGRVHVLPTTLSTKKANATLVAQYCRNHIPKTCDHSLLSNQTRYPRPCTIAESFLSSGNSMTLQLKMVDSTALRSVSFKALYEFVDLHQDGEPFGTGPCSRKFVSRSHDNVHSFAQKFQSPRDVFLFGRGGNTNLSCVYRFEGQKGERVKLNIQNLATGSRPCRSLYHRDINRVRCHGNATAAVRIYEYPWVDSLGVPRDCLCSDGDGITPFSFTSSTHIVELRFDLLYMNASDDFRNLHFEGSWEFVRQTVCTREQREKGPSGEIHFQSPSRTPDDINCEFQPWIIEPSSGKFLYVKVKGIFIEKDLITYEDVVNNVSIASKTPKCETKNRILIYSGRSVYAVVCPQPSGADKHRSAEVFSEGWVINESEHTPESVLMVMDAEKRNRILRARNVIVEYLGKETGSYRVQWLELSRRKPVLPPEGYVMKDCFHRCPELDACINSSLWCDGVSHCPSGYDESIRHCYEIFQLPALYLAFGAIGMICLLCAACIVLYRSCRRRAKRRQCRLKTLPSDSSVFEDKEVIC